MLLRHAFDFSLCFVFSALFFLSCLVLFPALLSSLCLLSDLPTALFTLSSASHSYFYSLLYRNNSPAIRQLPSISSSSSHLVFRLPRCIWLGILEDLILSLYCLFLSTCSLPCHFYFCSRFGFIFGSLAAEVTFLLILLVLNPFHNLHPYYHCLLPPLLVLLDPFTANRHCCQCLLVCLHPRHPFGPAVAVALSRRLMHRVLL